MEKTLVNHMQKGMPSLFQGMFVVISVNRLGALFKGLGLRVSVLIMLKEILAGVGLCGLAQ